MTKKSDVRPYTHRWNDIFDDGIWAEMTPIEHGIYPLLMRYQNRDEGVSWPSLRLLAKKSGYKSLGAVSDAITRLVKRGLIKRTRRGLGKSNLYSPTTYEEMCRIRSKNEESPNVIVHLTEAPPWEYAQELTEDVEF